MVKVGLFKGCVGGEVQIKFVLYWVGEYLYCFQQCGFGIGKLFLCYVVVVVYDMLFRIKVDNFYIFWYFDGKLLFIKSMVEDYGGVDIVVDQEVYWDWYFEKVD